MLFEPFQSFIVKLPALEAFFDDDEDDDDVVDEEAYEDVIITIEFDPDIPKGKISFAI